MKYSPGKTRAPSTKPRAKLKKPPQLQWQDYVAEDKIHFAKNKPVGLGAFDLTDYTIDDGDEKRPVMLQDVEKLDNEDFEPEQVDMAKGFKMIKKILQIPPTSLYQAHLD